jgi:hypothetical protein
MHITRSCCRVGAAALIAISLAASRAQADTIDLVSGSPCVWSVSCGPLPFTGGTLTLTSNGNFEYKVLNGETGLGVSGSGHTGGEIDIDEFVTGTFSRPTHIQGFRLLFLYNGPEFGDPFEMARVSINNDAIVATLVPGASDNSATWSLGGGAIVNSCGDTTLAGTGCFDILNPFGSTLVFNITLTALLSGDDPTHNSDFSLASFEVSPIRETVPEPASWLLVGTGAAAALRSHRRRH